MKLKKILILSLLATFYPLYANAQTCIIPPSCITLGYTKTEANCSGLEMVRCPLDPTKVFCVAKETKPDCATLGYTKTAANCTGLETVKCPFDQTKHFCIAKETKLDCATLGYTQTATNCVGLDTIACPFDASKVFCGSTLGTNKSVYAVGDKYYDDKGLLIGYVYTITDAGKHGQIIQSPLASTAANRANKFDCKTLTSGGLSWNLLPLGSSSYKAALCNIIYPLVGTREFWNSPINSSSGNSEYSTTKCTSKSETGSTSICDICYSLCTADF